MAAQRFIRTPDGRLVSVPTPAQAPEMLEDVGAGVFVEDEGVGNLFDVPRDDLSDITDVSVETSVTPGDVIGGGDADMSDDVLEAPEFEVDDGISDLFEVTDEDVGGEVELDEEDIDDLFGVSEADVMGTRPVARPSPRPRFRRTNKRLPPPTTLGGMR